MLARYRQDVPGATAVTAADNLYYDQVIKNEQYDVDSREVREYFRYETVKPGVLDVVSRLFGIALQPVDAPTWHDDVEVYDVTDDGRAIGRVYLDMHPRPGKFNHAAQFPLVPGIAGRSLPEGTLVCNFPTGLMEHDDVLTFFHELGHLVHEVLGGNQPWAMFTRRRHRVGLRRGAQPAARGVGLGRRACSGPSRRTPPGSPSRPTWSSGCAAPTRSAAARGPVASSTTRPCPTACTPPRPPTWPPTPRTSTPASARTRRSPETHQYAGFGHLDGYGSAYYTYLWSLVIAKDLRTAFTDGLMDPVVGRRYRDAILAPGGTADAADLVERFLGRPSSFDAFEAWLAEGTPA